MATKRRNFEIITYNLDKEEMLNRLKNLHYIKKFAFIVHDQDIYNEEDERNNEKHKAGELKTAHMHVMISCDNTYATSRIAKDFEVQENSIEFIKSSYAHAIRYLTHEIATEKHVYQAKDIIANFDFEIVKAKDIDKGKLKVRKEDVLRDIIEGVIKKYELAEKFAEYDIDPLYLVKWRKDIEKAFAVRLDNLSKQTDRNLEVIYIKGESGTGKTTLGKILAQKKGYDICITSGNNKDMLSSYQGQPCLLIDDPGDETFPNWNEALKLLDNHTSSNYKSRYADKSLAEVKLLILTSTLSIEEMFNYFRFDMVQIYRRIQTLIELDHTHAVVNEYDMKENVYKPVYTFKNPLQEYLKTYFEGHELEKNNSVEWIKEKF